MAICQRNGVVHCYMQLHDKSLLNTINNLFRCKKICLKSNAIFIFRDLSLNDRIICYSFWLFLLFHFLTIKHEECSFK